MSDNPFNLNGDVAVITGAGSGIGEGTAHVLAKAGGRIVCAGRRQAEIDRVAADIRDAGGEAIAVAADVTKDGDIEKLMQSGIDAWGRLDILVNNAGGSPLQAPLIDLPREEWDNTIALNLTAVWNCTRMAAKRMSEGGRVVNVSSIAAAKVVPTSGHYSAAKRGVNSLTESFAFELAPRIRVNAVMPGLVPTAVAMKALKLTEKDLPAFEKELGTPMARLGRPEDLGLAILFFASNASSWITGECLSVSGGANLGGSV
ncbi:MAG: SDR family oxidoreductase [Alphaproteobacteria bacterium]|nr:SDR family oxidoreductase [Alphaproteobacteria bacterium]